jgi:hypothetical protein
LSKSALLHWISLSPSRINQYGKFLDIISHLANKFRVC